MPFNRVRPYILLSLFILFLALLKQFSYFESFLVNSTPTIKVGNNDNNTKSSSLNITTSNSSNYEMDDNESWPPKKQLNQLVDSQNRLVITFVNCGYSHFADNWASHLEQLGITNYVLVPLDSSAERILNATKFAFHTISVPPFLMGRKGLSGVNMFGSQQFHTLTMTRPQILNAFLDQNYTVFYNDVDTVWRRNIWKDYIDVEQEKKKFVFAYARDGSVTKLCTCLLYLEPKPEVQGLLRLWQEKCKRLRKTQHDQNAFNMMWRMHHGFSNITKHILSPKKFPAGRNVKWPKTPVTTQSNISYYLLHTNFMNFTTKQSSLENMLEWNVSGWITDEILQIECN